jgi:hypothetical protein
MLGPLPDKTMAYFEGLSPKLSNPADTSKWLSGWEFDPRRASKETVRVLLEVNGDVSFANYWLRPEFEEKEMETLFTALMFTRHLTGEKRYQRRFRELLTTAQTRGARRILTAVRRIFKDGIEIESKAKVFCQRFGSDRDTLEVVFACLPKTSSGLALTEALYKFDANHFVAEAFNVWLRVEGRNGPLTPYQEALLFHLSKRRPARVQVERELEDTSPGAVRKLRLEEILKRGSQAEVDPDQIDEPADVEEMEATAPRADGNVDESETHSLGGRIKDFLGIGSGRKTINEPDESDDKRPGYIFGIGAAKPNARKQERSPDDSGSSDSDN